MIQDSKRITEAQVRRELTRIDDRASRRRAGIGAVVILALALVAGALATRFLFIMTDIRSDGMSEVLQGGDVALSVRTDAPLPFLKGKIEPGALALVRYSDSGMHRQTVRRVIAMAGDEISVDGEGRVTLNGEALEEPYATYCANDAQSVDEVIPGGALENPFAQSDTPTQAQAAPTGATEGIDDMEYPMTVPDGAVFVLCDNRDNRLDSRSSRFGLVAEADIKGMARAIIWPVYRAGLLDVGPAVK